MQSWADVNENTEMDFSAAPLPMADLAFEFDEPEDKVEVQNPKEKAFLSKIPKTGPFKVMVTNLPSSISRSQLQKVICEDFQIQAEVDYNDGSEYCFLVFENREQCVDSKKLLGKKIQGNRVGLKASLREQQSYTRSLNTNNKPNRFSSLNKDRDNFKNRNSQTNRNGPPARRVKHHVPVGGSIRKTPFKITPQSTITTVRSSNSSGGNPWAQSPKDRESNYKILNRNTNKRDPTLDHNPTSRFDRDRREDRGPRRDPRRDGPMRRPDDNQDMRRQDDNRDGYDNPRDFNRRRGGQERDFSNWRNNDSSSSPAPRRQRPMRAQPQPDSDGFTAQTKPVKQSQIKRDRQNTQKKKQDEVGENKKANRNAFAMLMDDEDEE